MIRADEIIEAEEEGIEEAEPESPAETPPAEPTETPVFDEEETDQATPTTKEEKPARFNFVALLSRLIEALIKLFSKEN